MQIQVRLQVMYTSNTRIRKRTWLSVRGADLCDSETADLPGIHTQQFKKLKENGARNNQKTTKHLVLQTETPRWWKRSEENDQTGLSWWLGLGKSSRKASLNAQHVEPWGKWATRAEAKIRNLKLLLVQTHPHWAADRVLVFLLKWQVSVHF